MLPYSRRPLFAQGHFQRSSRQDPGPSQRLTLGVHALADKQTITALADDHDVCRKFVYRQAATAEAALDEAFTRSPQPMIKYCSACR